MHITILTLFPDMFTGPLSESILKRAQEKNLLTIDLVNIRDFATDKHKSVDDHPYGGGSGMIMRVDIVDRAIKKVQSSKFKVQSQKTILLDPHGTPYKQDKVQRLSTIDHLILLCGHYEGIDDRIRQLVDEEISIGDYVLTGGEIPAMVVVDSIARLIPGVLGDDLGPTIESFSDLNEHLLEYPQYTKPQEYNGQKVPEVLLSGNHKHIEAWKKAQSKEVTAKKRPDLIAQTD